LPIDVKRSDDQLFGSPQSRCRHRTGTYFLPLRALHATIRGGPRHLYAEILTDRKGSQMSDVTRLLQLASAGDTAVSDQLLPLVYDELRRLAAAQMRRERGGQTIQPTALVHEAYLRLIGDEDAGWDHAGHFYAAAAEAMRRILIERARRKKRLRHGGGRRRLELAEALHLGLQSDPTLVLAVHDALERLKQMDPRLYELVRLRCFAGMSLAEAARVLDVSSRTLNRDWLVAKAWLKKELAAGDE
jgi:RNA polymerase sigma factor (TIGR02999 family)